MAARCITLAGEWTLQSLERLPKHFRNLKPFRIRTKKASQSKSSCPAQARTRTRVLRAQADAIVCSVDHSVAPQAKSDNTTRHKRRYVRQTSVGLSPLAVQADQDKRAGRMECNPLKGMAGARRGGMNRTRRNKLKRPQKAKNPAPPTTPRTARRHYRAAPRKRDRLLRERYVV